MNSEKYLANLNYKHGIIRNAFFECIVSNGKSIEYSSIKSKELDEFKINMLHMPFAFLLFQKNVLPLHSMAFKYKNKAILIAGPSTYGKSTIGTELSKIFDILSEDIVGISFENNKCYAIPSFPIILSDSYKDQMDLVKYSKKTLTRDRKILKISNFNSKRIPIKNIFYLDWGENLEIYEPSDEYIFRQIVQNSFKPMPTDKCIKSNKRYFHLIMSIMKKDFHKVFNRPKNSVLDSIDFLISHIET